MDNDKLRALLGKVITATKSEEKTKERAKKRTAEYYLGEEPKGKSNDALDRPAFRKGGFSKAEKRAYAQQKAMEELVQPPKNPPPAWLNDPSLLPKKPPKPTEE